MMNGDAQPDVSSKDDGKKVRWNTRTIYSHSKNSRDRDTDRQTWWGSGFGRNLSTSCSLGIKVS